MALFHFVVFLLTAAGFYSVDGSPRYYGTYLPYGTGDTIMYVLHMYGGTNLPHRKWLIECQDGEAVTGLQDFTHDFERLETVKCQFIFPNKPSTQGVYPYYPSCHVRNYTNQFFCFDPLNANQTINTFVTGLWDTADFLFQTFRPGADDQQLYKCCKTPNGYYIDYVSCYYMPTHDLYFEYYDSPGIMITQCATGYITTGISKKLNPWTSLYNVDYIQCCRVGFGPNRAYSPPVLHHGKDQTPVYYSREAIESVEVPAAYRAQYQGFSQNKERSISIYNDSYSSLDPKTDDTHIWSSRYAPAKPQDEFLKDTLSFDATEPPNSL